MKLLDRVKQNAREVVKKASDKINEVKSNFNGQNKQSNCQEIKVTKIEKKGLVTKKEEVHIIRSTGQDSIFNNEGNDFFGSFQKNFFSVSNLTDEEMDIDSIEDCNEFSKFLVNSPMQLTNKIRKQIYELFPVPVEQEILWADCEFDLRCSGVVCTNKGIFIKSNVSATKEKKEGKSVLSFYSWLNFNPHDFIVDSKNNTLLTVDLKCQSNFKNLCTKINKEIENKINEEKRIEELEYKTYCQIGLDASILSGTNWLTSSKALFVEKNASVNTTSGHGFMAEDLITKMDRMRGIDAKVIGVDNAKNGADRYINRLFGSDIKVQTKYYKTWRGSLDAGFDANTHSYRYVDTKTGVPMQLEVPKDQYNQVVEGFKRKILSGHFKDANGNQFFDAKGMDEATRIAEAEKLAKKMVRKGRLTYQEAVNITKPGTIESLKYDAINGAVTCSFAFGLSFVATTFLAYRETKDMSYALKEGFISGIKVCGLTFANHMIISQFSRTELAKSFVNAANKNFSRLLRNSIMTSGITIVVYSIPDMVRMFQNKISMGQFVKNTAVLAGGVAGGAAGAAAGAAALGKIGKAIGGKKLGLIGSAVGGVVGGIAGGLAGSKITKEGADIVKEDDDQIFMRLLNVYMSQMVGEYFLDEKEIELLVKIMNKQDPKVMKNLLYAYRKSSSQEKTIREFLIPIFNQVISKREKFVMPKNSVVGKEVAKLCVV